VRPAQLLVSVAATAAALVSSGPAGAAECPTQTFLSFDHLAYAARAIPAQVELTPGVTAGGGTVDEPTSPDGCKRNRETVTVLAAGTVDPRVAVMVRGRPRTVFVLGARCAGLEAASYWNCLLHPLAFDGRSYTGTSYPAQPAPRRTAPRAGALGRAQLGGMAVTVVRIRGVDPSLAVGVRGRPSEAFLAPAVCPYEGFENTPAQDDLLRCLRSPVWFAFDPLGAEAGADVVARSDRPPGPEVDGAPISLVRLSVVADVVPTDRAGAVRVGRVGSQVEIEIPDLPDGLYEAVVSCPRCASTRGGRALFPAGSLLVSSSAETSTTIRIVSYGLTAALVAAALAALLVWRRRRASSRGSGGS
jgi:hypothetical protein